MRRGEVEGGGGVYPPGLPLEEMTIAGTLISLELMCHPGVRGAGRLWLGGCCETRVGAAALRYCRR